MVEGSNPDYHEWSKFTGQLSTPYMGLQDSEGLLVSLDTRVGIPLGNKKRVDMGEERGVMKKKNIVIKCVLTIDCSNLISRFDFRVYVCYNSYLEVAQTSPL